MDLTDIVDFKAGFCYVGLGAKVEATDFLAAGLGFGMVSPYNMEFFGRRADDYGQLFVHLGVFGIEAGGSSVADRTTVVFNKTSPNAADDRIPPHSSFRVGGEILIPLLSFGAYLNLGEVADFILGFATIDIAGDDGLLKGSSIRYFVDEGVDVPENMMNRGDEEERESSKKQENRHNKPNLQK